MKKKYTIEELNRKSAAYFKANPKVKELHATEDGMFFINSSYAINHNKEIKGDDVHSIKWLDNVKQEVRDLIKEKKEAKEAAKGPAKEATKEPTKEPAKETEPATEPGATQEPGQEPEPDAGEKQEAATEPTKEPAAEFTQLDLEHLQEEYEEVTGKKPGNRKADTLQKEIEDAKAKQ